MSTPEINEDIGASTSNGFIQFGQDVNLNDDDIDYSVDNVFVIDGATPLHQDYVVSALVPISDGTHDDWSGSFADVDEIPEDTVAQITSGTGLTDSDQTFNFTANADALGTAINTDDIENVSLMANMNFGDGQTEIDWLHEHTSTTTADGGTQQTLITSANRWFFAEFDVNPDGSVAWTQSNLAASEFGIRKPASDANSADLATLWLTVLHKPSAGGGGGFSKVVNGVSTYTSINGVAASGIASVNGVAA
jgi:hypothetical protein